MSMKTCLTRCNTQIAVKLSADWTGNVAEVCLGVVAPVAGTPKADTRVGSVDVKAEAWLTLALHQGEALFCSQKVRMQCQTCILPASESTCSSKSIYRSQRIPGRWQALTADCS